MSGSLFPVIHWWTRASAYASGAKTSSLSPVTAWFACALHKTTTTLSAMTHGSIANMENASRDRIGHPGAEHLNPRSAYPSQVVSNSSTNSTLTWERRMPDLFWASLVMSVILGCVFTGEPPFVGDLGHAYAKCSTTAKSRQIERRARGELARLVGPRPSVDGGGERVWAGRGRYRLAVARWRRGVAPLVAERAEPGSRNLAMVASRCLA